MNRLARIFALAWSLLDVTPEPLAPSSRSSEPRGPSPSHWAPCPTGCDDGVLRDRFGRPAVCGGCGGQGRVRVDPYLEGGKSSSHVAAEIRTREVLCDRCAGAGVWRGARCEICDGAGHRSASAVGVGDAHSAGRLSLAEGEVARLRKGGSYDELEWCLLRLRQVWPQAHRAWVATRVECWADESGGGGWLAAGDRLVAELMPPSVRVPEPVRVAWLASRDGATRDARVRAMAARGVGSGEISQRVGVSQRRVQQIVHAGGGGR